MRGKQPHVSRNMTDTMTIAKQQKDKEREETAGEDSMGSSPEDDQAVAANMTPVSVSNANGITTAQEVQQPKRKGGRKPIYATSEERKQRNRQAQAAFRERRTEYIKQLEERISIHENNLQNLQAAHRNAADECLMLRYKNSLLERILLEKGIDVQAELRAKTGSPNLGPTHMSQNIVQPPPMQRAMMNRHSQGRRPGSMAAKMENGPITPLPPPLHQSGPGNLVSPRNGRPTPSSHHSNSPTASGPTFGGQAAISPAASDMMSRNSVKSHMSPMHNLPAPQQMMSQNNVQPQQHSHNRAPHNSSYYPTPGFQNHMDQLEQEYDTQNDMVDDAEMDPPPAASSASYGQFHGTPSIMPSPASTRGSHIHNHPSHASHHHSHGSSHSQHGAPQQPHHQSQSQSSNGQSGQQQSGVNGGQYPSMTQLLDPTEWDPFGLSASMAFPTPFAFDSSHMR